MRARLLLLLVLAAVGAFARVARADSPMATLRASDATAGMQLGESVALSDRTLVVGAPGAPAVQGGGGAAYVFALGASGWTEQARLAPSRPACDFGWSVAIDDETAVVSASRADLSCRLTVRDSAWVFVRRNGAWTEQAQLTPTGGGPDEHFAQRVAISGNTIVVGAMGVSARSGIAPGAAYVFERTSGRWTQRARLAVPEPGFGAAVAIEDDTLVVASTSSGRAHVFARARRGWRETAVLTPSDGGASPDRSAFGGSVAVHADTIVVGAPRARSVTARRDRRIISPGEDWDQAGAVYVYARRDRGWIEEAKLTIIDGRVDDSFGTAVAVHDDVILASRPYGRQGGGGAEEFVRAEGGAWRWKRTVVPSGVERAVGGVAVSPSFSILSAPRGQTSRVGSVSVYARP